MAYFLGSSNYFQWKKQTAFGTKASMASATVAASPLPESVHFRARQYRQNRLDNITLLPRAGDTFNVPKIVDWGASFLFYQNVTLIDFLCSAFGTEIRTGAAAPFTHKWYIAQPFMDGGTDPGSGAGTYYGRALTLQHVVNNIGIGWEIENAVVNSLSIVFEQAQMGKLIVGGVGANKANQGSPTAFSYPTSAPFNWAHLATAAGPPTSGIWVTSAAAPNTPVQATNDLLVTKLTFNLDNNLLIQPALGIAATQQFMKPERDGYPTMEVVLEGLADTQTASLFSTKLAIDSFINAELVNIIAKASAATNSILEFQFTKNAEGMIIFDDPELSYSGDGLMRWQVKGSIYPITAVADAYVQLTSTVS